MNTVRTSANMESANLEQFEPRLLLSLPAGNGVPIPAQDFWALGEIHEVYGPLQSLGEEEAWRGPLSQALIDAQTRIADALAADPATDLSVLGDEGLRIKASGDIQVYVHADLANPNVVTNLESVGFTTEVVSSRLELVQGWVPWDAIDSLLNVEGVLSVTAPAYGIADTGSVNTAGDSILRAADVRSRLNVTGQGVRVGVISDGVEGWQAVAASPYFDLPSQITIASGLAGAGYEGTAMLEIVHDLAPDADLYFATGQTTASYFAAVDWMIQQGVNVIVDDMSYYVVDPATNAGDAQPYFQDGPVAQAAMDAISDNVVYITAAGNWQYVFDGNAYTNIRGHWQGQYRDIAGWPGWHNFSITGIDRGARVWVGPGSTLRANLEWSDPWGQSSNNYDLYLFDLNYTGYWRRSILPQTGSQNPWEGIQWTNNTGVAQWVNLVILNNGAPVREMELFMTGWAPPGAQNTGVSGLEYVTGDSLVAQRAVEQVITAGAIGAFDPNDPDNPNWQYDAVESFSGQGPSTVFESPLDFQNQNPHRRESLDGCAIDRVETRVGKLPGTPDPFPDIFAGTSAAAPHVAGLAALLLQLNPGLTPAGVSQALTATAVDLTAYGSGYDETSGWGRADGLAAAYKVYTPDTPDLQADSDTGISSTDNITNDTTPTFVGTVPAGSYVRLYVDDVLKVTQDLGDQVTAYSITTAALAEGSHLVTVRLGVDSSTPTGNLSYESDELEIWIDTTAPTATITEITTPRSDSVQTATFDFGESIGDFSLAALNLRRDGGSNLLSSSQTPTTTDQRHWTVPNLAGLTGRAGAYELKLTAAGSQITDVAGNALAGDAVEEWLMDTINGTSGADTVTLSGSAAQVVTTGDSYAVDLDNFATHALYFKGGEGTDKLIVELANGNPVPAGTVTFDGEDGEEDELQIVGTAAAETVTQQLGQVRIGTGPLINYTEDVERVWVVLGAGNDTLTLDYSNGFGLPTGGIMFEAGDGTDTQWIYTRPANDVITFALGDVPGVGQTFCWSDLENMFVDAGGGSDTLVLDYSQGDLLLPDELTFLGGDGDDGVKILGSPTVAETLSVNAGEVQLNSYASVMYDSNVEYIWAALDAGTNNVEVNENLGPMGLVLGIAYGGETYTLTAADPAYTAEVDLVLMPDAQVQIDSNLWLTSLSLNAGCQATLTYGGKVLVTKALYLAESSGLATARLDITDGSLVVDYTGDPSPMADVRQWINQGYNNGDWLGDGITSSLLDMNNGGDPFTYAIGYSDNALADMPFGHGYEVDGLPLFGNVTPTAVNLDSVLVKFTYIGDINLDGMVDDNDVGLLTLYYNNDPESPGYANHQWFTGDFWLNDGICDDNDVGMITLTYGLGVGDPL